MANKQHAIAPVVSQEAPTTQWQLASFGELEKIQELNDAKQLHIDEQDERGFTCLGRVMKHNTI